VIDKVEWLLSESHFIFAGIDIEVSSSHIYIRFAYRCQAKTFQRSKPFGSPIIKQLLEQLIFKGRDQTIARMVQKGKEIPLSSVILCVVAVRVFIRHIVWVLLKGSFVRQSTASANMPRAPRTRDRSKRKTSESGLFYLTLTLLQMVSSRIVRCLPYRYKYHEESFKSLCQKNEAWGRGYCRAVYKAIAESNGIEVDSFIPGNDMRTITAEELEEGLVTGPF
jgi:hypothetical protein